MTRFAPNAPATMWLKKHRHKPVNKLAALAIVSGMLLGSAAYLYENIWLKVLALLLYIGGCFFIFGLRGLRKKSRADKGSSGQDCLY
jgi:Flp pilus assembly protein TadB